MELLTRTFRTVQRTLSPNGWFTLAVVLALVGLEAVGRSRTASDLHDALAVSLLALLGTVIYYRHRSVPLPWVSRITNGGKAVYTRIYAWTFELGIDMRGTPRIKRGYPPGVVILGLLLLVWLLGVIGAGVVAPHAVRDYGVRYFYLGYLLLLAILWALLIAGILLAFFIPMAMIHDVHVHAHEGPSRRARQPEMFSVMLFFGALLMAGWLLPVWVQLTVCAAALLVNISTTALPANADVKFLWRPRQSIQVRAMPWAHWITCEFALITVAIFDLVLTACGANVLWGESAPRGPMPFTAMLGTVLAWFAPGLLVAMVWQSVLSRWRDPARPARPTLQIHGEYSADQKKQIARAARSHGWRARFNAKPVDGGAVPIQIVPPEQSQATEFDPGWPLKLSLADFDLPAVLDRLARRGEIVARRRVSSALERLFKIAAKRSFQSGHGFWVAPHFWFVIGLTRDAQEEEIDLSDTPMLSGTVGPAFHRVMPRASRHHIYQVMRALHVDLIFVEDGVKFKRFVKVLRRMFEVFDKHAGRKPAEDIHFVGLPGTRVIIHEFQLDDPFKSSTYPEPKYDYLGRARILHVFRDRNEQEEFVEPPFDITRTPSPLMR